MEDSTAKTIEFLRARLLAERSVSRTAKQRAYDLAERVSELEKQLKFVSLQRKKAERATVDVLTILENHGRNDISEPFDSSSDQEGTSSEHRKVLESDIDGFSGSEVESSSVSGRSLSWKSSKNSSSRFLEKKYVDASRRRRNSFTSTGSSPRRVGKSCRQIRHREHRSRVDGSQNDDRTNGHNEDQGLTSLNGVQNSADVVAETSTEQLNIHETKVTREGPTDLCNGHLLPPYETETDMEKALEHQAQFVARYEQEERAQREWEDKFKENNRSPPDSCDLGTHSDITEERDEIKPPVMVSQSKEIDANSCEEPKTNTKPLPDQTNSNVNNKTSNNQNHPSHLQDTAGPSQVSSSQNSSSLYKAEQTSGNSYEPTIENSDELGSVLEALQQAKLSLKQNLEKFPLIESGPPIPSFKTEDNFTVPFNSARLFRLPTDYEYERPATRPNYLTYDPRLSLTNYPTDPSEGQFMSSPYRESHSRSATSLDNRYRVVPTFPYHETMCEVPKLPPSGSNSKPGMHLSAIDPKKDPRLGVGPSVDPRLGVGQSVFDPRLGVGSSVDPRLGDGSSVFDPRMEMDQPFTGDRYTTRIAGLPPYIRYGSLPGGDVPYRTRSFYDDYTRPNT